MSSPERIEHTHVPIYRVVRRGWPDPLDASFSQRAGADNRWNTPAFAALYCACSERVSRAVARDIFRLATVEIADLQDSVVPQLVETEWTGEVVDMASAHGIDASGFASTYPEGSDKAVTRAAATDWHAAGAEGVLTRSASLVRQGQNDWDGGHERWSEIAIFVDNSRSKPVLLRRRSDLEWLTPTAR